LGNLYFKKISAQELGLKQEEFTYAQFICKNSISSWGFGEVRK
jgi:hypothetical protein